MCAAVAIVAPTLIKVVYGLRWIKAVPLVVPLALSMPLFALMAIEGPVLTGLGRPEKEMRAQWYTVLWGVILLGTASQVSLQATAWAVFVLYLVRLILMTRSILDVLDISKWVVLRPVCVSAFLTLLVIGVVWEAGMLLPAQWTLLSILLIQAFIGLGVWGGVLVVGRRWFLGEEAFWIVRNLILTSRIPIVKKIILALC
jgi:O-antigen/teichoic acid export membrane protein